MSTIAAISTAPGIGGIGIIRISGNNTFEIINKIFIPSSKETARNKGYTIKYGHIIDPKDNKTIDEVLVSFFVTPKSYTTEDMCEINSHGSLIILRKVLEICLENGAVLAEPGEFTKRAFLNGRIDLSQAEAVVDIINSKTEKETGASLKQLEGFLSEKIKKIKNEILEIMSTIEASIDYPEYEIENLTNKQISEKLINIKTELENLESSFANGKILRDGISVAIIGRPNAGKSSLLNAILREERAIVTDVEGTTRDTIEEYITIQGIPLKIIDTAGIRKAKDEVEKIGIERAKKTAEKSDFIIAIFDITKDLNEEDKEIIKLIENKDSIIVLNKSDIKKVYKCKEEISKISNKRILEISAKNKNGIEELFNSMIEILKLKDINIEKEIVVTNVRHKRLIELAKKNIEEALETIKEEIPIDMVEISIKNSLEFLGEITGENVSEDIMKEIFSKFCLGK